MKTLEIASAAGSVEEFVRRSAGETVVFTKDGKAVATLVPAAEADAEAASLSMNPRFMKVVELSRARLRAEGGISSSELRRRLALDAPADEPA